MLYTPTHTIPNKSHFGEGLGSFPIRGSCHPLSLWNNKIVSGTTYSHPWWLGELHGTDFSHRPIFFINLHMKIFYKKLGNSIQQCEKRIVHHDKWNYSRYGRLVQYLKISQCNPPCQQGKEKKSQMLLLIDRKSI